MSVGHAPGLTWLTPMHRLFRAEHKLIQYWVALQLGLPVPPFAVCSDKADLPVELGDPLVVKPLGPAHYTAESGNERVVYANVISRDGPELHDLAAAPFLLQERLKAEQHLRIVTVIDRAWVCELEAGGLPLDWRTTESAHRSFFPSVSHEGEGQNALRLATALGVGYSSQDWLVADGKAWFLDLNPGGQWLFLPEPVASEVTETIAGWLCHAR
jgi:glutathione synthase/RimK-type ligase-like ATP-grasp enzyme